MKDNEGSNHSCCKMQGSKIDKVATLGHEYALSPRMHSIDALSDEELLGAHNLPENRIVPFDLNELSDDEQVGHHAEPPVGKGIVRYPRRRKRQTDEALADAERISLHTGALTRVVKTNCKCKNSSCRSPWRESPPAFDKLLSMRLMVHSLPKLDSDQEAQCFKHQRPELCYHQNP